MNMHYLAISLTSSFILLLLSYKATAITYGVYNPHPESSGGARFENEVGSDYALKKLSSATEFIWQTFNQTNDGRKPGVDRVALYVFPWKGEVRTKNNQIHISSIYIYNYQGDLKREIARLLYHEMTHIWQWTGNGQAPKHVIEGVADYVKIKAGYAEEEHGKVIRPGEGRSWDQGFEITAYFLDYCDNLRPGFVAELNARMKEEYNVSYFQEMLGKPVERLWDDYKEKYGGRLY